MADSEQHLHKVSLVKRLRRLVVKIGSSSISGPKGLDRARMASLVEQISAAHDRGLEVVVVTSGAVAAGVAKVGQSERPKSIPQRQAAAAVGQIDLMTAYGELFGARGKIVAQVLLSHDDLAHRQRYINAKHTLQTLLLARVVPVANENDTVAVEELNFGDNDNLSALVATLVDADLLVILSDVAGLYDKDPRHHADARLIPLLQADKHDEIPDVSAVTGPLGRGGMAAKIAAARKASTAGIATVIADSARTNVLLDILDPEVETGTLILPGGDRLSRRKHWIAFNLRPTGALVVDEGAYAALRRNGGSLLPKGLREVRGRFRSGACVRCLGPDGEEFARGLVSYSAADLEQIKGLHSNRIEEVLGYKISDEVIHRDDLALLGVEE
jgi:glutamate 5-kinase